MNILTPDLVALFFATILIFAAEHLILSALAEHYPWARLPKPASYTLGVSTLFGLFLIHAALNGHLEAWGAFAILTGAAGVTVKVLWVINPMAPRLECGAGPTGVDLTNAMIPRTHVLALRENQKALMYQILNAGKNMEEAFDLLIAYYDFVVSCPDVDPDLSLAMLQQAIAMGAGKERL